jgi:Ig-like domain from next to BRCA1 gene
MGGRSSARRRFQQGGLPLLAVVFLSACAPGVSPEQVQLQVQTGVAQTVEAQNAMASSVAMTVAAIVPTITPTPSPTEIPLDIPTLTPVIPVASVTPFVSTGGGGGGSSSKPTYACDVQTRPFDNTAYKPGDPFDIKWVITNTGTATWEAGKDLEYYSGPHLTTRAGVELPRMEPGDTYTFTADANAPEEKGFYVMTWKVEGGFCWPYVAIYSGK